jgi:CBS-domain-containing membrane protein
MAHATAARGLMSAPALDIAPDASLSAAARKFQANKVKRQLVTGDAGQLLGIVSRADLLRVYARPDTAIGRDVTDDILRCTLWLDTDQVYACVQGGVVTLAGTGGPEQDADGLAWFGG